MFTDLSTYKNTDYKPGSILKIAFWYFINRLFLNTVIPYPSGIKVRLLRIFGAKIGLNCVIKPKVSVKYPWFLEIGDNTWLGEQVWIDNLALVVIGKNVCISQAAMLLSGNHDYKKTSFDLITKEIHIQDGVWIGAKAVVCCGVICASHSILTVGSIANKNLNAYGIYQGNPAVEIRKRTIN
jgi:putative colanic acid biosynthesis acetyltransferase WcaF